MRDAKEKLYPTIQAWYDAEWELKTLKDVEDYLQRQDEDDTGGNEELDEFRELAKALSDALRVAIPAGLAVALLIYLLSRRRMVPAPVRKK